MIENRGVIVMYNIIVSGWVKSLSHTDSSLHTVYLKMAFQKEN